VLAGAVFMLLRGLLVPRSTVDKMMSVYEERIAEKAEEAKEWKEAWRSNEQTKQLMTQQFDELLEIGRLNVQLLRALPTTPTKELSQHEPMG
jgi:Tfp pilus assembly protein PilO